MREAIVQLGAGPIQRELVRNLLEEGVVPMIVDRAIRPAGFVPGAIHVRAPIDQPAEIVAALEVVRRNHWIRAVVTSTDLGVASVPMVSRSLGLESASLSSIEAMDDKEEAKRLLGAAGVRVPQGETGHAPSEIGSIDESAQFVVKPAQSSGSRGVQRVRGRRAALAAAEYALTFSDRFLIEECIDGDHLDINGFVRDGQFSLVSIGQRFFSAGPDCVPIYGGIDGEWHPQLAARVTNTMQRAVEAFGYRFGLVKADAIERAGEIFVLELAARFHGDVFSDHTSRAAGQPPALLAWLAEIGLAVRASARPTQGAWFGVFAESAGRIRSIDGVESFLASKSARRWIPRLHVGDSVEAPSDNRALIGFGLIGGMDTKNLWDEVSRARSLIRVGLEEPLNPLRRASASVIAPT